MRSIAAEGEGGAEGSAAGWRCGDDGGDDGEEEEEELAKARPARRLPADAAATRSIGRAAAVRALLVRCILAVFLCVFVLIC